MSQENTSTHFINLMLLFALLMISTIGSAHSTRFTVNLSDLNPALCAVNSPIPSSGCNQAFREYCVSEGYASGFGRRAVLPSLTAKASIICMTEDLVSEIDEVPYGPGSLLPGCNPGPGMMSLQCRFNIHAYCRQQYIGESGYGPISIDQSTQKLSLACVNRAPLSRSIRLQGATDYPDSCVDPFNRLCVKALDDYCAMQIDEGWIGGFGPLANAPNAQVTRVTCVQKQWLPNEDLPEQPSRPIDVAHTVVDSSPTKTHPSLSPRRSMSFDGKLYVRRCPPQLPGCNSPNSRLLFAIQQPEKISQALSQENPSVIVDPVIGKDLPQSEFHIADAGGSLDIGSVAVCDPHQTHDQSFPEPLSNQQSVPRRKSNPYTCGDRDCYDLRIFGVVNTVGQPDEIWATDVKVEVASPKQSNAQVVAAETTSDPQRVPMGGLHPIILEPTMTGDGRIIVVNNSFGGLRYSYNPTPCAISDWSDAQPISSMVNDTNLNDHYGMARYPLRTMQEEVLESGTIVPGAYPWLDRDGDALMWMQARQGLFYIDQDNSSQIHSRVPVLEADFNDPLNLDVIDLDTKLCVFNERVVLRDELGNCPNNWSMRVNDTLDRIGVTFTGLWTHGKMISPDNRNNNADFGITNKRYWNIGVYDSSYSENSKIALSSTESTLINSPENQFLYLENLRTETPSEVVWHLSTKQRTDELSFDDYLLEKALIISPMNAPIDFHNRQYADGFVHRRPNDGPSNFEYGYGFINTPRAANFATSVSSQLATEAMLSGSPPPDPNGQWVDAVNWSVPVDGKVMGGARIEPVAAGGYQGKGIWLDGINDRIEYTVPDHPDNAHMADSDWFVSLALDPRDLSAENLLMRFSDGTQVYVVNSMQLAIQKGLARNIIDLNPNLNNPLAFNTGTWTNIAFLSQADALGGFKLKVFINGFLLTQLSAAQTQADYFRINPGNIMLGSRAPGFRGWVDDFKVIAESPSLEEVCNHARGTLVEVSGLNGHPIHGELYNTANAYPTQSHQAIINAGATGTLFACERPDISGNSSHDDYLCLTKTQKQQSRSARCRRDAIHLDSIMGTGQTHLIWNLPRPDSLNNTFCLSCHTPSQATPSLQADALAPSILPMFQDPRRQPLQASPLIFGNIPADLFGPGLPMIDLRAPLSGENQDQYLHPDIP